MPPNKPKTIRMKRFNTILNLLFLLMISAGMTSCQGLIDAIIGDFDLSSSTTPPTTPTTKKAATISFAATSVGKTFGDDPFINPLTNTGDSKVAYLSSNTAVATVNAATGQVTIVGNGTTTITAIVADTDNYTYATKTAQYTLGVGTATMTISASGYSGTYDGEAHSITVTVISPADATVKYGTAEGTYDLDASPTYTNAGTYTVYYQVSKPDYTIVTGSANVTIEKKAAAIHFTTASVGKTFGDAAFTNALTNTGDGTVTYSSDNTAVAEVNATTGEVTIKGNGEATIKATVADTDNYTYETKTATYTLGVGTATMTVTAKGYTGTYDGSAHGITVNAPTGATVKYGTTEGTYNLDTNPTYTNVGTYTVYYQVKKDGYNTVTGSAQIVINKATMTASAEGYNGTYDGQAHSINVTAPSGATVKYGTSAGNCTQTSLAYTDAGTYTIFYEVTKDNYTPVTGSADVKIAKATMTVTATGYTGTYDGSAHGIIVNAPTGAIVKYGTSASSYDKTSSPTYTNAGTNTVYYQVTKDNYTTVTGSADVKIAKAAGEIKFTETSVEKNYSNVAFKNDTFSKVGDGAVSYSSNNTNVATVNTSTGEVTITGTGIATITATVADSENYTYAIKTAKYTIVVKPQVNGRNPFDAGTDPFN